MYAVFGQRLDGHTFVQVLVRSSDSSFEESCFTQLDFITVSSSPSITCNFCFMFLCCKMLHQAQH